MSDHAEAHGNKTNFIVWGGLLLLTIIEVVLAYVQLDQALMLILLLGFSFLKAFLIVAYFMHMKFERISFVLTVIPATLLTISLLSIIFPEGYRVIKYLPEAPAKTDTEKDAKAHDHDH